MKLGINTFLWTASFGPSDFHRLPEIKAAGFDGIEVFFFEPDSYPAASVARELARIGLECTAVAVIPASMSFVSSDASTRSKAKAHVQSCIRAAAEVGSPLLCGPMYSPVAYRPGRRRTTEEWKWAVESWQQLGDTVTDAGIEIGIEPLNRFDTYFLNTTADGVAFCKEVAHPKIGLLVDTFHASIEEKSIANAIRLASPHLKHLHVSENDRGTPGSGQVHWIEFFAAVDEIGYDRWLTIEGFGFNLGDLSVMASIWRDLERNENAIAFDGMKFVRGHLSASRHLATDVGASRQS